jgi:hypothetical protein
MDILRPTGQFTHPCVRPAPASQRRAAKHTLYAQRWSGPSFCGGRFPCLEIPRDPLASAEVAIAP